MDLYSYVSIESFVRGCKESKTPETFTLHVPNLLYAKSDEVIGYGLSLLRRSIVLHEVRNGVKQEFSKQNIPFFRENRRDAYRTGDGDVRSFPLPELGNPFRCEGKGYLLFAADFRLRGTR